MNRLSVIFFIMMTESFSLLFAEIQIFPFELPILYNEVASGLYRVDDVLGLNDIRGGENP